MCVYAPLLLHYTSLFKCFTMCLFCRRPGLLFDMLCHLNSPPVFTLFIRKTEGARTDLSDLSMQRHAPFSMPNVFIPRRLSGHRQVNRQNRSHLQTLPSLSQTFHISTLTSAMRPVPLPVTLIGSVNIKLDKSCEVLRTQTWYPATGGKVT